MRPKTAPDGPKTAQNAKGPKNLFIPLNGTNHMIDKIIENMLDKMMDKMIDKMLDKMLVR